MNWLKEKIKFAWLRAKKWVIGIMIALGIVAAPIALSAPKDFTWTNATQRVDGSPFPAAELAETRIYCDGNATPVVTVVDGSQAATVEFTVGSHSCYATHVDTDGQESDPSNTVTFVVTPARPNPPVLSVN